MFIWYISKYSFLVKRNQKKKYIYKSWACTFVDRSRNRYIVHVLVEACVIVPDQFQSNVRHSSMLCAANISWNFLRNQQMCLDRSSQHWKMMTISNDIFLFAMTTRQTCIQTFSVHVSLNVHIHHCLYFYFHLIELKIDWNPQSVCLYKLNEKWFRLNFRANNNWQTNYASITKTNENSSQSTKKQRDCGETARDSLAYSCLLKNELLGNGIEDVKTVADDRNENVSCSAKRGLFKYQSPTKQVSVISFHHPFFSSKRIKCKRFIDLYDCRCCTSLIYSCWYSKCDFLNVALFIKINRSNEVLAYFVNWKQ